MCLLLYEMPKSNQTRLVVKYIFTVKSWICFRECVFFYNLSSIKHESNQYLLTAQILAEVRLIAKLLGYCTSGSVFIKSFVKSHECEVSVAI